MFSASIKIIVTIILAVVAILTTGCQQTKQQPNLSQPQAVSQPQDVIQPQAAETRNRNERGVESLVYIAEKQGAAVTVNISASTFTTTVEQGRQGTDVGQASTSTASQQSGQDATQGSEQAASPVQETTTDANLDLKPLP